MNNTMYEKPQYNVSTLINTYENTLIKDSITNIESITFTKFTKKNMNIASKIFNIDFCLIDYDEGEAKMDNICNYLINTFI